MHHYKYLSAVIMFGICPLSAYAANGVADARGNAMGNTGVTTSDYLLAPFYNPALTAVYRDRDSVGLLVPALGANVRDSDESLSTIDDLQSSIDQFEAAGVGAATQENINQLNGYLDDLADDKPFAVSGGAGIAVALPMNAVSLNFFARGYAEILADSTIAANTGNTASDVETRYQNSYVNMLAFGYSEYGVAVAKLFTLQGQQIAIGITPKIQELRTYKEVVTVQDFDLSDYDQSKTSKNAFNLDIGAVWLIDNFRAGIAAKDLISQEIKTYDDQSSYTLDPQVTVSGGYVTDFLALAIDWDLTKQKRFKGVDDDTQFLRFGVEGNAWGWAQLRAGYEIDLESTLDNSITAGLGISPGDLVSVDLAANYAGNYQYGLSANLAFTF
ncbi:conjugal transfer protein TraF [Vibrio fluvialis]|uniref:conjugal transfer protein TraF n=1 Tax=Vibrio fluvialis TaxID=676 RepID=UPI001C9D7BF1|nr:conjugal transfer protein TraF [Vibrio fluvialis]EKO3534937.1 conjugal transfer protein TraF [Vibrio fluvialis]EKO3933766.1 conjugal transfer protein TraF [Vibrio fluvialis]EKO3953880.1 conjugal transfer protein TraF [Vibrio fluvialis]EKO4002983.1 type IX secretion system membrane protein PorP/SprF [Vibrio fluvialis]MBY7784564.1 conjugal transfer protein TraF [Vibrio fluvialis]